MRNPKLLPSAALVLALSAVPALAAPPASSKAKPKTAPKTAAPAATKPAAAPAPAPPSPDAVAAAGFSLQDADKDGKITRAEWKGNDIAFAMQDTNGDGVLSGAEVAPRTAQVEDPAVTFAKLDANHDGKLARSEWPGIPTDYDLLDHNGDGAVSRDEFLNLDRERGRLDRLFRFLDKNHDSRLSKKEWSNSRFDELDRNHDGIVTREEFANRQ